MKAEHYINSFKKLREKVIEDENNFDEDNFYSLIEDIEIDTQYLFRIQQKKYQIPELQSNWVENFYDEIELLGFTIQNYFSLVIDKFHPHIKAKEMSKFSDQKVLLYGQLVTTRFNKTTQDKLMRLSTFIDAEGNYFDAVHFTNVVHQYPINGMGVYALYGKITNRFGFCSMNIIQSKKMSIATDPRS